MGGNSYVESLNSELLDAMYSVLDDSRETEYYTKGHGVATLISTFDITYDQAVDVFSSWKTTK